MIHEAQGRTNAYYRHLTTFRGDVAFVADALVDVLFNSQPAPQEHAHFSVLSQHPAQIEYSMKPRSTSYTYSSSGARADAEPTMLASSPYYQSIFSSR